MKTLKLMLAAALVMMTACTDFDEPTVPVDETVTTRTVVDAAALRQSASVANPDNPYAVSNLTKAMRMYAAAYGVRPWPIYATHEYVRFQARDSLDYYILEDSLNLELFDYPLDRVLGTAERDFYSHDIVNGAKWLYTLVPKNFLYPTEMDREVLQDVYIQDDVVIGAQANAAASEETDTKEEENAENSTASNSTSSDLYEEILKISMQNAGIEFIDGPSSTGSRTWVPSAVITYVDDLTGEEIPLQNVTVRVSTMMNVGTALTNDKGEVVIPKGWGGKFRNPVNYSVKFKSNLWKILSNHTGVAQIYADRDYSGPWKHIIWPQNKETSAYAAVHRALQYFFYQQNDIEKPFRDLSKIRIAVFWDEQDEKNGNVGDYNSGRDWWGLNGIRIWGKSMGDYRRRFAISGTTFHEAGHASHRHAVGIFSYGPIDNVVKESYARTVQYYFLSKLYPNRNPSNYRTFSYFGDYTGIGEALLNHGFTISHIESAVKSSKTWGALKGNIKAFKVIPDWLVDYLFYKPLLTWDFNLLSESFTLPNNSKVTYQNIPTRVRLRKPLQENGAQITDCTSITGGMTFTKDERGYEYLTFSKTGLYLVLAKIRLENGVEYTSTQTVNVEYRPTISGDKYVHVGEEARYTLDDYTYFVRWNIKKYSDKGGYIDARDMVIPIDKSSDFTTQLVFNFVFLQPGLYQISASMNYGTKKEDVTYEVTIPEEEIRTTPADRIAGLYPVQSQQHKVLWRIRQRIYDGPVLVDKNYVDWNSDNDFYTFNKLPSNNHPYYSIMQPIYRYPFEGGEAYDNSTFYILNNQLYPYPDATQVFYVLKRQVPGSVPVYCMEMTAKDTSGSARSRCRILSTTPHNTTYYFEGGKYEATKIKQLGFVFKKE